MRAVIRTSSVFLFRPAPAGRIFLLTALLAAAACTTVRPPIPDDAVPAAGAPLSGAEADRAEALARYSQFLLLQAEQPDSLRLPDVLREALRADPSMPAFHLWLAQSYLSRGKAKEALPGLEEAVRLYPDSDILLYLLGLAYESVGRRDEARALYQKLVRQAPRQPDAYLRLAGLAILEERNTDLFAILDEALRRVEEPLGILSFYENLGDQFLAAGKPWLAVICFSKLCDREPRNRILREKLMKSRLAAGDREGTKRELAALEALEPAASRWPLTRGELAELDERHEEALEWFSKAASKPDAGASVQVRLALAQSRSDPGKGLATLKEAAARYPADPLPFIAAGAILYNARRPAEAVAVFDAAEARLKASPPGKAVAYLSPSYYYWYGAACDQAGQPEKAELFLERSIALFPEVTEAYNNLAYIWAQKGVNLDKALTYARVAVMRKPDNAAYLDTLGWVLFKQGDFKGALEKLEAASRGGDDPEIAFHMGEVLHALDRRAEAESWWRKSAEQDPGGPAAARLKEAGSRP